jgi:hypothetical protein
MTEARSLHRKLAQVMYEAESIPKNGNFKQPGEYGHFKFVQVGDAANVIRKALAEKNVSMIPSSIELLSEAEHETAKGGTMTTITVRTTWTLTDGDSGETAIIQSMGSGADTGDKASPKAQTNAMKYALLMGFLLSTGDDPELSDSSDRGARVVPEPVPEHADGLIGTVEAGKAPVDMELRYTPPDGVAAWGFKLKNGRRAYQVLARGPLADALATLDGTEHKLAGARVTVWGHIEMVPWDKAGKPMPPYPRIDLERIQTPDETLPVSPLREAESLPMLPLDEEEKALVGEGLP